MKKKLILASVLALVLGSCNNDDEGSKAVTSVTIKEKGVTDPSDSKTVTAPASGKADVAVQLEAQIEPDDAADKDVTWSISKYPVAVTASNSKVSIDANNGKVTVKAGAMAGDYVITATSKSNTSVSDTFTVTVNT